MDPGCTLTLGANLNLTNTLDLRGTLNGNGFGITAPTVLIGYNDGPFTVSNRGPITAGTGPTH